MSAIVNRVLSMDSRVREGADSYIDDIIVNEDVVSCDKVVALLEEFGLKTKPAEPLIGGRVLGLRISEKAGIAYWSRDNKIDEMRARITKRQVFSLCGQLVGHFPVAGWLRPASSFIKRSLTEQDWEDEATEGTKHMLYEVVQKLHSNDPVRGRWAVSSGEKGVVWCDASSLAIGVCIELDGVIVEDACWLRKPDDSAHINLAELEAVLKGINLALKWNLKWLEVKTDSASVYGWVSSMLSKERRIKTHGLGEALVRRRLTLLGDVIEECELIVKVELVRSENNKADGLTRVPKAWLSRTTSALQGCGAVVDDRKTTIKDSHNVHHFGVDRSLYVLNRCYPNLGISREEVEEVVKNCRTCLSIDPAPVRWETGKLECDNVWHRVAMDVTHVRSKKFLTLIDCGPSRYAIWRPIIDEGCEQVTRALAEVFSERGPPAELLTDNSRTFRSAEIARLCDKWSVRIIFRCVNRPSGNGIVERNHRTIKRMAARSGGSIQDMLLWYNFTPREGGKAGTSPSCLISSYRWRCPGEPRNDVEQMNGSKFEKGDIVFVKPEGARCTTRWKEGVVTGWSEREGRKSPVSIEVDGVPYHFADVRRATQPKDRDQEKAGARSF